MNRELLRRHIREYKKGIEKHPERFREDSVMRQERRAYYQAWTKDRILRMSEDDFHEYLGKLWAMLIWGNKKYVSSKLIEDHGFNVLRKELAELVWGDTPLAQRWDAFRSHIKGMGPAMMSEVLAHTHPQECMLWNRRAYIGLNYLGVENLPKYNYQSTGQRYVELSQTTQEIADELKSEGFEDVDLLTADYFIWEELQVEDNLTKIFRKSGDETPKSVDKIDATTSGFIHDEIRDKLASIGQWLGLQSSTEVKVAEGSKVDAIWEQVIGNMGRVIYVFEVQTKGSIDSLIVNLLKSLNNPAVQGVVAVSDETQLEKIRKHAAGVHGLRDKIKYWNYERVLEVYDSLESVNSEINSLGLVPSGF